MFDHVGDQEVDPQYGISPAEELALAIALLSIGIAAAYRAEHELCPSGLSTEYPLRTFFLSFVNACAGQFLDTRMGMSESASADDALNMTSLKSGSLGRLVAGFGASLGTNDPDVIAKFEEFGFNLFTYLQLIDDIRDASSPDGGDSDLTRNKKTIPLVFFYNALADVRTGKDDATIPDMTALKGDLEGIVTLSQT